MTYYPDERMRSKTTGWNSRAMLFIILAVLIEHLADASQSNRHPNSQPRFDIDHMHEDDFLERLIAESSFLSENHRLSGSNKHLNSDLDNQHHHPFPGFKKTNLHIHNKPTPTASSSSSSSSSLSIASFIEKVTDLNTCSPEMMQYETQAKFKSLQSVISTCSDYCRLAMSHDNQIYGAKSFHLDTIWQKIAEDSSKIIENNALIGAYYMKFVVSGRYLCINKKGDLYSSINATKGCLWFTSSTKIISAYYSYHLALTSNCQVKALSTPLPSANHQGKNLLRSIISGKFNPQEALSSVTQLNDPNSCNHNLNITSGFAPDLKKFINNCQTSLLKQSYRIPSSGLSSKAASVSTLTSTASTPAARTTVKPPVHAEKPVVMTTTAADFGPKRLDKLCRKYLKAKANVNSATSSPRGTAMDSKFNAYSYELVDSPATIPDKCLEYVEQMNEQSRKKELSSREQHYLENEYLANRVVELLFESPSTSHIKTGQHHQHHHETTESTILTSTSKPLVDKATGTADSTATTTTAPNKFKKCYALRNKPGYKECMNKYYKCFNPNFTAEELRKCRERNGITPAPRLNLVY